MELTKSCNASFALILGKALSASGSLSIGTRAGLIDTSYSSTKSSSSSSTSFAPSPRSSPSRSRPISACTLAASSLWRFLNCSRRFFSTISWIELSLT